MSLRSTDFWNEGEGVRERGTERGWRKEEGVVNPFPTVCHICGLTQTGKQAALLRKPQTIPQRNLGLLYGRE